MKKGVDFVGVTVSYLCHDGNRNILLAKRSDQARDEHGRWDNGGGGLEFGDTVADTLIKEVKEEYCADIIESEFLGYRDIFRENKGTPTHWVGLYFKVLVDPAQVRNGEPHKFDEIGWFKLEELPSPLHSQVLPFLREFAAKLQL
jgi:ADP-ribose pyrophosphatase YjhB (NUDIX family)